MQTLRLGKFFGFDVTVLPSAFVGMALIWIVLSIIAVVALNLVPVEAIFGGLLATLLHIAADILHQIGHARAARRTGYPMTGVQFWGVLLASVYPPDEPALPADVHIRRALGGPKFSLVVSVVALLILLFVSAVSRDLVWWLALFFFLDNFLTFTLGSFLPLGFTDGSTILYWRSRR